MTNKHPLTQVGQPASPTTYKNIFSFGDVSQSPLNDIKCIVSMMQFGNIVAKNILEIANETCQLQPLPTEVHKLQVIPFG